MTIILAILFITLTNILFPIFGKGEMKFAFGFVTPVTLAREFFNISSLYDTLGERGKMYGYIKIARILGSIDFEITKNNLERLRNIKGIGDSTIQKIRGFLDTGKIKKFEEIRKQKKKINPHKKYIKWKEANWIIEGIVVDLKLKNSKYQ